MSHYLVTGGCGFIGRHLTQALNARGDTIVVLDDLSSGSPDTLPPGTRLIEADICDAAALAAAVQGTDGIFHLAAISSVEACAKDRSGTLRVNLGGTQAVVAASDARPLIFTSSAAVYGDQPVMPVPETAAPRPISPYAEDKLAAEASLRAATGPAIALRPFNVYGPGQAADSPYSGVITRFVTRARAGAPLRINGAGQQTRDFIHVRDVARGLLAAMDRARDPHPGTAGPDAINLCSGEAISVLDLAATIARLIGSAAPLVFGPARPGDIQHSLGDPSRAASRLGFRTRVRMEQGLADLLATI